MSKHRRFGFIVHAESEDPAYYKTKALQSEKLKYKVVRPIIKHVSGERVRDYMRTKGCCEYTMVRNVGQPGSELIDGVVLSIGYSAGELQKDDDHACEVISRAIQIGIDEYGIELADLGAHTAIVGDHGRKIAEHFEGQIPIITGNYTTTLACLDGLMKAAKLAGYDLRKESVAIIGGGGSIGSLTARYLARYTEIKEVKLVGRGNSDLSKLVSETGSHTSQYYSLQTALETSSLVVCCVSSTDMKFDPSWFKLGAIVVEISRPRIFSERINKVRPDVLVIAGGMMRLPGNVKSTFLHGMPPDEHYGCISEGFLRMSEPKLMHTAVGKSLDIQELLLINDAVYWHGFKLGHLRPCDDKFFSKEVIDRYFDSRVRAGALRPIEAEESKREFVVQ